MDNWEPNLPTDVKYRLVGTKVNESEHLPAKKRLMPCLQLQYQWEQINIKEPVETLVRHKKTNALIIIDVTKYLTRLKWVKKCFWKIKEGWTEKMVNFHLNSLAHS